MAALSVAAFFYAGPLINSVRQLVDQRTLATLNDALNRWKGEGGDVNSLTQGAAMKHVMAKLASTITFGNFQHQVMQKGFTVPARSVFAKGSGAQYHFTAYNTYAAETGGTSPTGVPTVIYLTAVGSGTWTVPADWNSSNNTIECIGGGGNGITGSGNTAGGGGGGAYAKVTNLTLTPGNSININVGGAATATWFNATSLANAVANGASISCAADYGRTTINSSGGAGGLANNSVGTTRNSGGSGGVGGWGSVVGGGGGAAGPNGDGGTGGAIGAGYNEPGGGGGNGGGHAGWYPGGAVGGTGGNNYLNTGGGAGAIRSGTVAQAGTAGGGGGAGELLTNFSGGAGGAGNEWGSYGSGGGGGGSPASNGTGGPGGLYGGGGGGYGSSVGTGAQGIIVITYLP